MDAIVRWYIMKEQGKLEAYWAKHKYSIMERHYADYKAVSTSINLGKETDTIREEIGHYMAKEITHKGAYNTFMHVWGYLKNVTDDDEKSQFFDLLDQYKTSESLYYECKGYLAYLTGKYQTDYLLNSLYFNNLYEHLGDVFATKLVGWYESVKRDLPWRKTKNPYNIWLSEIMCQQTQVATVIDYYHKFLDNWQTFEALASADEDAVMKAWEGLGYYGRARRLLALAKVVASDYDGVMPSDYKSLLKLPGIGPYTAGAILSIVYDQKIPAIDGNVLRVISRTHKIDADIADPKSKKLFEAIVTPIIPDSAGAFNQGLMELGATVCTPTKPNCGVCPLQSICLANKLQIQDRLPVKSKARKKKIEPITVAFVVCGDKILIEKATHTGLLGGLFGLPFESDVETLKEQIIENYTVDIVGETKALFHKKHVFTHKVWEMNFVQIEVASTKIVEYPVNQWVTYEGLSEYPISTAFLKGIKSFRKDHK